VALAQASVLSETAARRTERRTPDAGENHSPGPSGRSSSLFDAIARRIAGCRTDGELEAAVEWAEDAVTAARKARPRPVIPFKTRILVEWEGHHDDAVAKTTNTPRTTIRRWRQEDGRDPLWGRPRQGPNRRASRFADR